MRELLNSYYDIHVHEPVVINEKTGYKNNEYSYLIIQANNNKAIQMEQIVLAYYLFEVGFEQVALPIQNRDEEWITTYDNKQYIVVQVENVINKHGEEHGLSLARFHQTTTAYPFEPESISSYGQWKKLWIEKLTQFETQLEKVARDKPSQDYRLLMDVLPYIIGISENAIQYMQESEQEQRFDLGDQATITFFRYQTNIIDPIIWPSDLFYDHPVRDLAEYIRRMLLQDDQDVIKDVIEFTNSYEQIRVLSPFSWRLLYARLLYPGHLFDEIASSTFKEKVGADLNNLFSKQFIYEKNLRQLFEGVERNNEKIHIPMVHWL